MKQLTFLLLTVFIVFTSCKKNDDDNAIKPAPVASRTLNYEVTGNYKGTLYASYTTAFGGTNNEMITTLPWKKEITFESKVTASNIVISGNGGIAG